MTIEHIQLGVLVLILGTLFKLYGRFVAIETKLDPLWDWYKEHHNERNRNSGTGLRPLPFVE